MDHSKNSTADLETLGFPSQVFLVSLYSVTALCAFASNLITIVVLIKGRRCTRDLRKFLINLSVADLLMSLFTIPFTYTNYMFGRWIFWPIMCSIVNMAQLTTITVSVFTLVAIAIDRYFAIMHPLQRSISWFKAHRALIVLVIWIFGITIGLTQIWVSKTGSFVFRGATYNTCGERWLPESLEGQIYTGFIFTVTFALPMAILSVVYSAMGCRLLRYRMPGQLLGQSTCHGGSGNSLRSPEQSDLFAEGQPASAAHHLNGNHCGKLKGSKSTCNSSSNCKQSSSKSDKSRPLLSVPNGREPHQQHNGASNEHQWHKSQSECKENQQNATEQRHPGRQLERTATSATFPPVNKYSESDNEVEQDYDGSNETLGKKKLPCHMGDSQPLSPASPKDSVLLPKINEPRAAAAAEKKFSKSASDNDSSSPKVLKMLITIIGVFTLCWLPIQIFNILIYFAPNFLAASSPTKYYCFVFSYFFCHWISCAHSMLNPLIYSFMSKNFREDIRYIFGRFWHLYILRKDHFRASAYSSQQQQHYIKQQQQQQQNYLITTNNSHHPPPVRVLHNSVASQQFFGPSFKGYAKNHQVTSGSNSQSQSDSASASL